MKKEELLDAAEIFGVEVDKRWGDKNIIAAILDEGVTWNMYKQALRDADPTVLEDIPIPEPVRQVEQKPDTTKKFSGREKVQLIKMERLNPTYNILGYRFTREHPFALVKPEDASWLLSNEEGFRVATPEEAEAFYK